MDWGNEQKEPAFYDKEYALRTCIKEDQKQACVIIYSLMEEFEEAVELALQLDVELTNKPDSRIKSGVELAKYHANRVTNDDERSKKLWLRIARHVVENKNNIKEYVPPLPFRFSSSSPLWM